MLKIYMVFIDFGFGGVKYFQNSENASKFAESVGEKVDQEYATPHEWHKMKFED